ncbi:MAG: DUF433 domain-containing protein [Acidobacteria bacterium]|nr:DUF433 domain-containing protein [Acidobacteriota bacterium]
MRFARVTVEADKMGGVPCIRGLRVPVAMIVSMVADAMTVDQIVRDGRVPSRVENVFSWNVPGPLELYGYADDVPSQPLICRGKSLSTAVHLSAVLQGPSRADPSPLLGGTRCSARRGPKEQAGNRPPAQAAALRS